MAKLDSPTRGLGQPNKHRVAVRMLDAFAREVEQRTPNPIPEATATDLRGFVAEIRELLASTRPGER